MELRYIAGESDAGRRLDRLLRSQLHLSGGLLAQLKRQNGISVNGAEAHADLRVRAGDEISVRLPEISPPEPNQAHSFKSRLRIVFEDEALLIVDKPAPLSSMKSPVKTDETLEDLVFGYLGCYCPVNRLDKGTSGLMVIAKNGYIQSLMQKALHTDAFVREYLAVAQGIMQENAGSISLPIEEPASGSVKRFVSEKGRECRTDFQVLDRKNGHTLLRLRLYTGRTHQIRVHLAYLGHPLVGDYLYGTPCAFLPERFALHSAFLSLEHPLTGERIGLESPLPDEILQLI